MKRLFLVALVCLVGCSDDVSKEDLECIIQTGRPCDNKPGPTPTVPLATPLPNRSPTPVKPPVVTPKPTQGSGSNPACVGVMNSREHLLWKPVSDTSGNAVVVFDGKYKREFNSVKLELADSKFEELFHKGLELWGNPDKDGPRQHWRSRNKCSKVKQRALILADDGYQVCKFQLPAGDVCKRYE